MALTPYEFGKETGRLHGQLDFSAIDEERAEHLAEVLYVEGKTEFLEGYRNGFVEGKEAKAQGRHFDTPQEIYEKQTIPNPSWLPSEDELAEAEQEIRIGLEPGEHAFCFVCEDPDCKGCPLTEEEVKGIEAYNQMARDESGAIQSQRF